MFFSHCRFKESSLFLRGKITLSLRCEISALSFADIQPTLNVKERASLEGISEQTRRGIKYDVYKYNI